MIRHILWQAALAFLGIILVFKTEIRSRGIGTVTLAISGVDQVVTEAVATAEHPDVSTVTLGVLAERTVVAVGDQAAVNLVLAEDREVVQGVLAT